MESNIASNAGFKHKPLNLTKQQIRLVKFTTPISTDRIDKADNDVIEMAISHYNFDEVPEFTALSYAWGPPLPVQGILLNGQKLDVRENLWEFLKIAKVGEVERLENRGTLRLVEASSNIFRNEWLWVDQLCIDQQGEKERNHQVQMMGEIYRKARTVVAWLGPARLDGELAKIMLLQSDLGQFPFDFPAVVQEGVEQFLRRSYWTRLWILQELLLARQVVFMCGKFEFDWGFKSQFRHFEAGWGRSFLMPIEVYKAHAPDPLHTIINRFHDIHCTWQYENPHDAIYGLMGLVPANERLETDYSKPRKTLLFEVLNLAMPYYAGEVRKGYKSRGYDPEKVCLASRRTAERTCRALRIPWPKELSMRQVWADRLQENEIDEDQFFGSRYWRIYEEP